MFGFGGEQKSLGIYGPSSMLTSNHLYGWQENLQNANRLHDSVKRGMKDRSVTHSSVLESNREFMMRTKGYHSAVKDTLFRTPTNFLEKGVVGFANKTNDYLARKGRGYIEGGFKTVGEVAAAAPLKSIAGNYKAGLLFGGVLEFGLMGKPITLGNVAHLATENIAFSIGSELAGNNFKGIAKYMGWQMIGSELGLGTWGSLGLQIGGSLAMPGLGWGLGVGMMAYKAGKGIYQGLKGIHDLGQRSRQTEFGTRDNSWQTGAASTMRERALGAIQNSHLNLRSVLGNEARMLMMAR